MTFAIVIYPYHTLLTRQRLGTLLCCLCPLPGQLLFLLELYLRRPSHGFLGQLAYRLIHIVGPLLTDTQINQI